MTLIAVYFNQRRKNEQQSGDDIILFCITIKSTSRAQAEQQSSGEVPTGMFSNPNIYIVSFPVNLGYMTVKRCQNAQRLMCSQKSAIFFSSPKIGRGDWGSRAVLAAVGFPNDILGVNR